MDTESRTAFHFSAQTASGAVAVARFVGQEALSAPFVFDIDLLPSDDEALDLGKLLDGEGLLHLRSPGGERWVHGVVARADDLGEVNGNPLHRVRLVPRLWRLGLTQRSRLFQGKTVPEIVAAVLDEGHVAHRLCLSSNYPARDVCVQYRESDLNFVSRLLESEGIFYFFEHEPDGHVMVLGDTPRVHPPISGEHVLPFRERGAVAEIDHVTAFAMARAVRTGAVTLGDFDFVRPTMDMKGAAQSNDDLALENYDYPGHQATPADGKRLAKIRLEALRCDVDEAAASSTCSRMAPGATFELDEHASTPLNQRYLTVEVSHRGEQPDTLGAVDASRVHYVNEFRCIPANVPYRPPLRTRQPVIAGVQTAVVVGPGGEEIHTDEHGRIKVQFHWDREGKKDDRSSAWVRVSQAWAGPGWGALYLPRIGTEVVLRFLEGNPDRPLVVGAVYNGLNPPPLSLPSEKTKSTLRSSSSPGGSGSNELQFEDAAGSEQILLHAQKDERIAVENDKDQTVGGFETLTVAKDRKIEVRGEHQLQVARDDASTIGGGQTITVNNDRRVSVGGDHNESVTHSDATGVLLGRKLDVGLAAVETITLGKMLSVGGVYMIDVLAASSQLIGGAKRTWVRKWITEEVTGIKKEIVAKGDKITTVSEGEATLDIGKDYRRGVEKDEKYEIEGDEITTVTESAGHAASKVEIKAEEFGVVVNGEIVMIINKAGTVKIFGQNITLEGTSGGMIKGKKVKKQGKGTSASKRLEDTLTDAEASTIGPGQGENAMLSADDVKGFKGGKYTEKALKKDFIGYRLHHGGHPAYPVGKWVTKSRVPPGLEGKLRCALDPTWGNNATMVARIRIPAGTHVFEGAFAPQSGAYVGQGQQLCIAAPKHLQRAELAAYIKKIGVVEELL
jgi:type VI secretion system secreted protein VgrG